jgi:hypothetical protein
MRIIIYLDKSRTYEDNNTCMKEMKSSFCSFVLTVQRVVDF